MSETICLPHKPDAPLSYQFVPGQGPLSTTHLVVYLNGLIAPQSGWRATIQHLQRRWNKGSRSTNHPPLLTYDRYGQGESARDPADDQHGGSHDMCEVVADLHVLAQEIWRAKIRKDISNGDGAVQVPKLIFVANSIGCVIGRFYAKTYPGSTAALLFLDSNIANSDLVSLFPDPDAPGFNPAILPPDSTVADLRRTRAGYAAHFQPSAPNPEHLDRRNIASLLPLSDAPPLQGPDEKPGPWITVVGHDWETFAEEGLRGSMNVPKGLTNAYMNPPWADYNGGLARLTSADRARGPLIATGCGHFIQKDDPALVAGLTDDLLQKIEAGGAT
ncbi:alpha/beta-hydrolase [Daldinia decipiens]|uniref:alpha/beta-hydrolase n=1 Tax=Daldinia decipiens TaxID=326647 RepID=UPI0020C48B3E|nr:alpha/beta-hydrolase [Daldinia decipiens]KAI1656716.1 alpha/beta-hydrolase [Daldinia decipiens]